MRTIDTVIIGGGQAGLALSRCLVDRNVPHVVLERGRIGERWRSERWDSLRLLTPRWQSRLPGYAYDGPDPDGYMTRMEVVDYLEAYADSFDAPIESCVTVTAVRPTPNGFDVETDAGSWTAKNVVVATGDCHDASVPHFAHAASSDIDQVVPTRYKNPDQLAEGGVLVVGASATGLQLAEEIHTSGRPVTLSIGRHSRLPRTYRGRDILAWFDEMGVFDERSTEVRDLDSSRGQPSLQLIGTPERRTLDLNTAQDLGIRVVGRTTGMEDSVVTLDDNLVEDAVGADLKLARLRLRIDAHIEASGMAERFAPEGPLQMTRTPDSPSQLDLSAAGIRTILWATGFKRSYPWLRAPVFDERGEIRHDGGITSVAGLYVMGLRFLRRRNSSFIDGQAKDAEEIADEITGGGASASAQKRRRVATTLETAVPEAAVA